MKKILSCLLTVILFACMFTQAFAAEPVTLTVLWFNDANESDVFTETVADYLAENPHVTLDMQVVAFDTYEQKLKMMIAGGNAPDLARMTTALLPVFNDSMEPLATYADTAAIEAVFAPSMLAFAKNTSGELIAYPTEATANGMLINKTAFDKAGVDVLTLSKTWTWAEWEEAVKKVIAVEDSVKYGLAVDFTPHRFSTILYQFGGRMMNEDHTAIQYSNEGAINAINWFKRMHDEGVIPQSVWMGSENPAEMFQAGLVACHIGGSWNINTYANITDFEWTAVECPKGEIRSSVPGGKFIGSFKDSPNKEEAAKLMAAFSDAEHNVQYCLGTNNLSSRVDVSIEYPAFTDCFTTFSEELKITPTYTAEEWNTALVGKIGSIVKEQVVQVLLGAATAEQACAEIDAQGAAFAE